MLGEIVVVSQAVSPGNGEDSFAVSSYPGGNMLCVADGCGGLGSRRYEENHTGAYLASRLAVSAMEQWVAARPQVPADALEARFLLAELQQVMGLAFEERARRLCSDDTPSRIVGSMQRVLPTTLCALLADGEKGNGLFIWAGDSRGYTLDAGGLHQYTRDDVRGSQDALEGLLQDRPLSNLISADREVLLRGRGFVLPEKGLLICASDGVYGALASPMELEMLLLDTLVHSLDAAGWQRKLERQLCARMQDDMTLLCCPCGFESFWEMQRYFRQRYDALKGEYIKPIRAQQHEREAVRALWQRYRIGYDRTEGTEDERQDWRV